MATRCRACPRLWAVGGGLTNANNVLRLRGSLRGAQSRGAEHVCRRLAQYRVRLQSPPKAQKAINGLSSACCRSNATAR
jgi:hypothetical protein